MNKSKLFASLAALSMTMTQTGQIQIFAKEEALKEDALSNDSYKADLQEQILKAQNKKEEKKKALDQAQKEYDTYNEGTYIPTKRIVDTLKSNYDASSLEAQKAIVSELEKQVANLKKALQTQLDETTNALANANSKLQEAQKKYELY